ncbi:hypothetical protein [Romboutsia sp.]
MVATGTLRAIEKMNICPGDVIYSPRLQSEVDLIAYNLKNIGYVAK